MAAAILRYAREIAEGALSSGVNAPTFYFLNGCLVALVVLCATIAFTLPSSSPSSPANGEGGGLSLGFHFGVIGVLAALLCASLNWVLSEVGMIAGAEGNKKRA